jgi:hypothetical protein
MSKQSPERKKKEREVLRRSEFNSVPELNCAQSQKRPGFFLSGEWVIRSKKETGLDALDLRAFPGNTREERL